jgi:hypothetical protein
MREHRQAVAVAAGFVVLLALASVASTGLAMQANRERVVAQKAKREVQSTMSQMDIRKAEECLANDQNSTALAYLARVMGDDRSNRVAAEMVIATLAYSLVRHALINLFPD